MDTLKKTEISPSRIRFGLLIWVVSYLPFPLLIISLLHFFGYLTSDKSTALAIGVMYGIQFIIGFIGLYIAGKDTILILKRNNYRKMPGILWQIIIHGNYENISK